MSNKKALWIAGGVAALLGMILMSPAQEPQQVRTWDDYHEQADVMMAGFCEEHPRQCR